MAKSYLQNKTIKTSSLMPGIAKPSSRTIAVLMVLLVFAVCKPLFASWNAGLPGAIFRLPAGAWASAMGGAASADPEYMISWYNPAQLPLLRDRRASAGAGIRSLGRTEAWASYDFRVPTRAGMGLALVYRGDPFISGLYDGYYSGNEIVEEYKLNSAAWSAVSMKLGVGYLMSRRWSAGGSIGVNYQSLPTTPYYDGTILNSSVTSIGALDIAASYKMTPNLTLSAAVKNLFWRNDWHITAYDDFSPAIEETVPAIFVMSSSHKTTLLGRGLIWNADATIFLIDGQGKYIGHPEMVVAAGAQWKFTDDIVLRAGLADIELSGDVTWDSEGYWDSFSPRLTMGFSYALPKWGKGAVVNYALMTDRVWAGVDQQFDISISF